MIDEQPFGNILVKRPFLVYFGSLRLPPGALGILGKAPQAKTPSDLHGDQRGGEKKARNKEN
jgi:hypothetical protein